MQSRVCCYSVHVTECYSAAERTRTITCSTTYDVPEFRVCHLVIHPQLQQQPTTPTCDRRTLRLAINCVHGNNEFATELANPLRAAIRRHKSSRGYTRRPYNVRSRIPHPRPAPSTSRAMHMRTHVGQAPRWWRLPCRGCHVKPIRCEDTNWRKMWHRVTRRQSGNASTPRPRPR